jgi:very-short-patch-repair endonuclease
LAREFFIEGDVIRRILQEGGIRLRSRSEAEKFKWDRMTPEQRSNQVRKAHVMTKGRKNTFEQCVGFAQRVFEKQAKIKPQEVEVANLLNDLGYSMLHQYPIGPYNVDLALDGFPIAVEIERTRSAGSKAIPHFRKRLKYILDLGWSVLYVCGTSFNTSVAKQIGSWLDQARRDETMRGKYGMIDCTVQIYALRYCAKFDGFPRVE